MSDEAEIQHNDEIREPSPEEQRDEMRRALGQRLRDARERQELSIEEAAAQLRLRRDYLEALENADWAQLPEEVYALGFLRQYARLLGVDVTDDIARLKSGDYRLTKPFTMPDPPIAPNRTWAIAAAIAFVLLLILFNSLGGRDESSPPPSSPDQTPPVSESGQAPSPAQPSATEATTDATSPATASAPQAPAATEAAPGVQKPDQASARKPAASGAEHQTAAPAPATPVKASDSRTPAAPTSQPATEPTARASSKPAPKQAHHSPVHRYRLTAASDKAWIRVRDASGKVLRQGLLQRGQSMRLTSDAPYLTVTCGNAAALAIDVDGKTLAAPGSLGAPGKVLRNFRITPPPAKGNALTQPMAAPALPR